MAYASGKYAYFICDTCGFRYPYKTAKTTWDNFKTCEECYETKHPQLEPPTISVDAEALHQPRPEVNLPQAQLGVITVEGGLLFTDDTIGTKFEGIFSTGAIGTVTVSTG